MLTTGSNRREFHLAVSRTLVLEEKIHDRIKYTTENIYYVIIIYQQPGFYLVCCSTDRALHCSILFNGKLLSAVGLLPSHFWLHFSDCLLIIAILLNKWQWVKNSWAMFIQILVLISCSFSDTPSIWSTMSLRLLMQRSWFCYCKIQPERFVIFPNDLQIELLFFFLFLIPDC